MVDVVIKIKQKADGFCGVCNNLVPQHNDNKFYCSEACRRLAFLYFHPEEPEDG